MSVAIQADSSPPHEGGSTTTNDSNNLSMHALPAYSPPERSAAIPVARQGPKSFEYKLEKKGKAFLVLTVVAEGSYSKSMPTFLQGTAVKGDVHLSLDQPETIQSIVVRVQGRFLTGVSPDDQFHFLDIPCTLWSQSDGQPANISSTVPNSLSPSSPGPAAKFAGKLQGEYLWPFSIDLPKEVLLDSAMGSDHPPFALPQTFNERNTRASIDYEVSLKVGRGKLKTDHRLSTQFGYMPLTKPPPFPPLRMLAYQEGTALMGPTLDLEGWHSQDPVTIEGTIFKDRSAKVLCTLFISKPLCYTRGALVPLCMRLESDDLQALDLISAPKGINVILRRHMTYGFPTTKNGTSRALEDFILDYPQAAIWWPSTDESADQESSSSKGVRYVNGELHLKLDLSPTSIMSHFQVKVRVADSCPAYANIIKFPRYSVVLLPFDHASFEYSGNSTLLEQPVDIVTSYASGPRAVKSVPPGYDSDTKIQAAKPFSAKNGFIF